jgi:hypothetical protein
MPIITEINGYEVQGISDDGESQPFSAHLAFLKINDGTHSDVLKILSRDHFPPATQVFESVNHNYFCTVIYQIGGPQQTILDAAEYCKGGKATERFLMSVETFSKRRPRLLSEILKRIGLVMKAVTRYPTI